MSCSLQDAAGCIVVCLRASVHRESQSSSTDVMHAEFRGKALVALQTGNSRKFRNSLNPVFHLFLGLFFKMVKSMGTSKSHILELLLFQIFQSTFRKKKTKKTLKIKSSETWIYFSTGGICHEEENKSPRCTQVGSDKSLIAYEHFQIVQ